MGSWHGDAKTRFVRHLLAATCLTAAGAPAAQSTLVTETSDFGGSFATRTALSLGTDVVTGSVGFGDDDDFFQLSGLTPSASFNVNFITNQGGVVGGQVLDSGGASLGLGGFDLGMPLDVAGTVPADGILVLRTFWQEGGPYQVTTTVVPEPATVTLLGASLGLLGWRRYRREG
jgi:hypothetical protein